LAQAPRAYVLDSFALLTFLQDEPGADRVAELLEAAGQGELKLYLSVLNLAEVVYRTVRAYGLERAMAVLARLEELPLEVVEVDRGLALEAALVKGRHAVAFADCLAAALARRVGGAVVTGDPDFGELEEVAPVEWLQGRQQHRG
jgi:ribonuclease VapC